MSSLTLPTCTSMLLQDKTSGVEKGEGEILGTEPQVANSDGRVLGILGPEFRRKTPLGMCKSWRSELPCGRAGSRQALRKITAALGVGGAQIYKRRTSSRRAL